MNGAILEMIHGRISPGDRARLLGLPDRDPIIGTAGGRLRPTHPCDTLAIVADVLALHVPAPSLQGAVDAFLAQPELADTSRRSYAQTTGRLLRTFGRHPARRRRTPANWGTA